MMNENQSQDKNPCRIHLTKDDLEKLSKEDLISKWLLQDSYLDLIEASKSKINNDSSDGSNSEMVSVAEMKEKMRQQQMEFGRREAALSRKIQTQMHEIQEYMSQIQELKQSLIPTQSQLKSMMLDPAVKLLFDKMRSELDSTKARLEETQNELSAWKFTPDSNTGKRLMMKCRMLHQENEELGKMVSSGRFAKIEGDLALQRKLSDEIRKSQDELEDFLFQLEEDGEGLQNTVYLLQQQLKEANAQIDELKIENRTLKEHLSSLQDKVDSLNTQITTLRTHASSIPNNTEDVPPNSELQTPNDIRPSIIHSLENHRTHVVVASSLKPNTPNTSPIPELPLSEDSGKAITSSSEPKENIKHHSSEEIKVHLKSRTSLRHRTPPIDGACEPHNDSSNSKKTPWTNSPNIGTTLTDTTESISKRTPKGKRNTRTKSKSNNFQISTNCSGDVVRTSARLAATSPSKDLPPSPKRFKAEPDSTENLDEGGNVPATEVLQVAKTLATWATSLNHGSLGNGELSEATELTANSDGGQVTEH